MLKLHVAVRLLLDVERDIVDVDAAIPQMLPLSWCVRELEQRSCLAMRQEHGIEPLSGICVQGCKAHLKVWCRRWQWLVAICVKKLVAICVDKTRQFAHLRASCLGRPAFWRWRLCWSTQPVPGIVHNARKAWDADGVARYDAAASAGSRSAP